MNHQDTKYTKESKTPDIIGVLATIGLPAYIVMRLVTGGWRFAVFLAVVCGIVALVYWKLGFFEDGESDDRDGGPT